MRDVQWDIAKQISHNVSILRSQYRHELISADIGIVN